MRPEKKLAREVWKSWENRSPESRAQMARHGGFKSYAKGHLQVALSQRSLDVEMFWKALADIRVIGPSPDPDYGHQVELTTDALPGVILTLEVEE